MSLAVHHGSWTPRAPTSRSWWSLHRHRAVLWQTYVALQAPPPGSSRTAACARGFFRSRGAYLVCFTRFAKAARRFPSEGSPVRRPSHDQVAFRRIQISRCHVTDFAVTSPAEYPPRFFRLNLSGFGAPSHPRSAVTRASGVTVSLGLARTFVARLAAPQDVRRVMRLIDVCFPSHSLRAPAHRAIPSLFLLAEVDSEGRRFTSPYAASVDL